MNIDAMNSGRVDGSRDGENLHECEFNTQQLKTIGPWPSLVLVQDAKRRGYDPYNTADSLEKMPVKPA